MQYLGNHTSSPSWYGTILLLGLPRVTLQRYLMKYLVKAPFPVRKIGAVMALLHVSHQLQDLLPLKDFERQYHFQYPPDWRDRKRWCFFFPTGCAGARERNAPTYT